MAEKDEFEDEGLNLEEILEDDEIEQHEQAREQQKEAYIAKALAVAEELNKMRQENKETQFMKEQEELYERNSNIALRSNRLTSGSELEKLTMGSKYVDIDSLEKALPNNTTAVSDNYFTIGILCVASRLKQSKMKTFYLTWMLTSLKKSAEIKPSEASSMRIKNGYKTLAVFIYGEASKSFVNAEPGAVYAIINPIAMAKTTEYEYAVRVTKTEQIVKIGKSLDFDYCKHINKNNGSQCRNFVNVTIEKYCNMHAHKKIDQLKTTRPALQSSYVDLNQIKKDQEEQKRQFLLGSGFKKAGRKNSGDHEMTKEEKEKYDKWQAAEATKLASFMQKRSEPKKPTNELHRILSGAAKYKPDPEKPKTPQKQEKQEEEFELEIVEEPKKEDDDLIKKIMEKKRKQTFTEKFGNTDTNNNIKQDDKRIKTDISK